MAARRRMEPDMPNDNQIEGPTHDPINVFGRQRLSAAKPALSYVHRRLCLANAVAAVPRQRCRSLTTLDVLHVVMIRLLVAFVISTGAGMGHADACSCRQISPQEGFDRAEYVFTGKVAEISGHTWTVDVDRVWKGAEKLAKRVRLLDVYASIDCESYFELGRAYIFFAIVAKSSRYVYYQSEVCNWTRPLNSTRVSSSHGAIWLEDLIAEQYGPGGPAKAEDPWEHKPGVSPGQPRADSGSPVRDVRF